MARTRVSTSAAAGQVSPSARLVSTSQTGINKASHPNRISVNLRPGRAVGSKLRYRYNEGGREGEMDGEVTAYEKPKRLTMRSTDKMMRSTSRSSSRPKAQGRAWSITSRSSRARSSSSLMQPLIRGATRKQTDSVVGKLKELLGATGSS